MRYILHENQPSSVDSTVETTSFSTTVMVPVACPFAKAYNPNDKYSDCTAYADWWQSFTEEEEPKSENYFTFTASMTSSESTSDGAGRWSGLGARSVVAAVALGVSGILGMF
ncbi:hypothetical protein FB645_002021 [Coemansia sp. IMI 203386]|nr:hypothetical protein FB645_002021 [Coemansia sp. IMI 203386]